MGDGIDLAREQAPEHAALLDNLKDQLLIVLIKRLADKKGQLVLPVTEVDDTGNNTLSFCIDDNKNFIFQIGKKS